jgi:hypothetical protein
MPNVTYYVVLSFVRDEQGDLVGEAPIEAHSTSMAISRAKALAATKPGVIAFSRTGDPELGEFADAVVLYKAGEVPDDATRA